MTTTAVIDDEASLGDRHSPKRIQAGTHIIALDGLRGLAIALVLVHHSISMEHSTGRLSKLIGGVSMSLWCGVDLFFVLSGFLVTRVLLNSVQQQGYFRRFYIRRTLRIFPLYYLVAFGGLVLACAGMVPRNIGVPTTIRTYIPLLLYITNFTPLWPRWHELGALFVFWSLAVEEHFYLVWPFAVAAFARRDLRWVFLSICIAAFICRLLLVRWGAPPMAVYCLTFCRMDALAAGSLVCVLMASNKDLAKWNQCGQILCFFSAIPLLLIACHGTRFGLDELDPLVQTLGYTLTASFMAGLLILTIAGASTQYMVRVFSSPLLRTLGKYSYGIYVWHVMFAYWAFAHLTPVPHAGKLFFIVLGIIRPIFIVSFSIAAAWLSYHLIERRMLDLKDVLAPIR